MGVRPGRLVTIGLALALVAVALMPPAKAPDIWLWPVVNGQTSLPTRCLPAVSAPYSCVAGTQGRCYVNTTDNPPSLNYCDGTTWDKVLNSGASTGMNTSASNASATAVGADWLPGTTNTYHLGNASFTWLDLYIQSLIKSANTIELCPRGNCVIQFDDNGSSNPYVASFGTFIRVGSDVHQDAGKVILQSGVAFASLGTPTNGSMVYCTDCTQNNGYTDTTCAASGNGALAMRLNGAWKCFK